MREYIELGSTPYEEDCAQVGSIDYSTRARIECREYIAQLTRLFGYKLEGINASLWTKAFPHDFGTYHEVVVMFDSNDGEAIDVAIHIENNLPSEWDEVAKSNLRILGYLEE